jgi:hypothetical protein
MGPCGTAPVKIVEGISGGSWQRWGLIVVLSKRRASWGSEFHENAFFGGERVCCDLGDSLHAGSSRNGKEEVNERQGQDRGM